MGNVLEILFRGYATDFFIFRPFPWPSNICDQYINAILYIILPVIIIKSIIDHRREKRESKQNKPSAD
jgi:lipoprotein signal peptidase